MRNKYGGICYKCRIFVPPGQGFFERYQGRWRVHHIKCVKVNQKQMNAYQILGIQSNANAEEIKKAYHKLAHKYHPDKGGNIEKMKEINQAYNEIKDGKGQTKEDFRWDTTNDFREHFRRQQYNYSEFDIKIKKMKVQALIIELRQINNSHPDFDIRNMLKREFNI